jgi:isopropylmalate/homocitrate/citramalate synthase
MSVEEKLEYFDLLVKIGFKEIEVGFPPPRRSSSISAAASSRKTASRTMSPSRSSASAARS